MKDRIRRRWSEREPRETTGPRPIGEILRELLVRYEIRTPDSRIPSVETPVAAA